MKPGETIVLCCSASFFKHACELAEQLQAMGITAELPESAIEMNKTGDFDVTHNKTWYQNPDDFHKKRRLIDGHFAKVAAGDGV